MALAARVPVLVLRHERAVAALGAGLSEALGLLASHLIELVYGRVAAGLAASSRFSSRFLDVSH